MIAESNLPSFTRSLHSEKHSLKILIEIVGHMNRVGRVGHVGRVGRVGRLECVA